MNLQRAGLVLAGVSMVALVLWVAASEPRETKPPRPENTSKKSSSSVVKRLQLPPTKALSQGTADVLEPGLISSGKKSRPKTNDRLSLVEVERTGLLGRSKSWLKRVMDRAHWVEKSGDPDTSGPTFINSNGVEMTFTIVGQQVYGASVIFPPKAVSADMTALSEFFIGQSDHFPLHWESLKRGLNVDRQGRFDNTRGQTLYYRGKLRETGEPPFGPARFEISLGPFEGQTFSPLPEKNEMQELLEGPR
ncbi:MAG: hypothetical protein VYA30_06690 [Myxococcota bacterium]|nr:hypothetical protein [Myxococcota bacterium]